MVTCPSCKGTKEVFTFENRGLDHRAHTSGMRPCKTCKGSGKITNEHMARIEKGRELRKDRLYRGMTFREEAARLEISVVELSRLERGETITAAQKEP